MFAALGVAALLALPASGVATEESVRNGEILFHRNFNFYGQGYLHAVNPDGSGARRLLRSGSITEAAWSPDGKRLVIAEQCVLKLLTASGRQIRQLTRIVYQGRHSCDADPDWSPDGKRLVFERCDGPCIKAGGIALYIVNVSGSGLRRLTQGSTDLQPAWSPDGASILFSRLDVAHPPLEAPYGNPANTRWLHIIAADGSGLRRVSSLFGLFGTAWSPDGARIAFARIVWYWLPPTAKATAWIGVMNADGSDERILVEGDRPEGRSCEGAGGWHVVWSPDGSKLAYSGPCPRGVYVMNPDGTDRVRVTRGPYDTVLDWRPLP